MEGAKAAMNLSIGFVTSRQEPKFRWFAQSLWTQVQYDDEIDVVVIDAYKEDQDRGKQLFSDLFIPRNVSLRHELPKPTIWAGKHRLTNEDWWSKSNSLNSFICLAAFSFVSFVDDRSVLMPGWLDRIKDAMARNYAVSGSYEKRSGMKVENGEIVDYGELIGTDGRSQADYPQPTKDWYGGHGALPLEWCLAVNGFSEDLCDSLGLEDCMFGLTLYNAGFPIRYDSRMKIVEDRTQGEIDGALKRTDKGVSPNDKSHAIVEKFQGQRTSMNSFNIRDVRERVMAGEPFPPPTASPNDWFDGQPISEM